MIIRENLKDMKRTGKDVEKVVIYQDESEVEKGLYYVNQELKKEFMNSYQRDLEIDALIDQLSIEA